MITQIIYARETYRGARGRPGMNSPADRHGHRINLHGTGTLTST
jgi:hypothetical protein